MLPTMKTALRYIPYRNPLYRWLYSSSHVALLVVVKVNEHDVCHVRSNVCMVNPKDILTECICLK